MKKVYLFMIAALLGATSLFAQEAATIYTTTEEMTPDGVATEAVWAIVEPIDLMSYAGETSDNTATWKAVIKDDVIYVLVEVTDAFTNATAPSGYTSDLVELYFDLANDPADDLGPGAEGNSGANGTKQFVIKADEAAAAADAGFTGQAKLTGTDANYTVEFAVPFATLTDASGLDITVDGDPIGLDIYVSDNDEDGSDTRNRLVWSNDGTTNEAWNDMDDCGVITLVSTLAEPISVATLSANAVSVYPNPAQNTVSVELENLNQVAIYNVAGQAVVSMDAVSNKIDINISELNSGVYYIKATDKSGYVGTQKIVKQ